MKMCQMKETRDDEEAMIPCLCHFKENADNNHNNNKRKQYTNNARKMPTVVYIWLLLAFLPSFVVSGQLFGSSANPCVRKFGCSAPFVGYLLDIDSVAKCQRQCDNNPGCSYFTWRSGANPSTRMFRHFCFLFSECGQLDYECQDCFTGPQTSGCPLRRGSP